MDFLFALRGLFWLVRLCSTHLPKRLSRARQRGFFPLRELCLYREGCFSEGFFCPPGQRLFCRGGLRPGFFQRKKFFLWGVFVFGFIFPLRGGGESPPAKGFFAFSFVFFHSVGGEGACGPAHFALRAHLAFGKSLFLSGQKK